MPEKTAQDILDRLVEMYRNGVSARKIAEFFGFDKGVVARELKRRGIEQRNPGDRNRLYRVNQYAFDVIDSQEAAYWLGFLYADGMVYHRTLRLTLKDSDRDHVIRFGQFMKSDFIVQTGIVNVKGAKHKTCSFTITHDHLAARLVELGIVKGMREPDACLRAVPEHLVHHWVRGLFDGDGSAHTKPTISLLGSRRLMAYVRDLFATHVGTNPDLKLMAHPSGIWYVRYSGKPQSLRIASYLYRDATIFLPRKLAVIQGW